MSLAIIRVRQQKREVKPDVLRIAGLSMTTSSLPRRRDLWTFRAKVLVLRGVRTGRNWQTGLRRHPIAEIDASLPFIEHRSRLRTATEVTELALQNGKIENLRVAVAALHGVAIPAGEIFSFWRQVGPPWRARGFVAGRELQQGCIVPGVGGGLCQLSNALYDLALRAGIEVIERHPHTRPVPGSAAAVGRDATVAWNHIDFRMRSEFPLQIEAFLTRDELVIRYRTPGAKPRPALRPLPTLSPAAGSCETCGQSSCFRHDAPMSVQARAGRSRQTFVLDAVSPEFAEALLHATQPDDLVLTPAPGVKRYEWPVPVDVETGYAIIPALWRMLDARRKGTPAQRRVRNVEDTRWVNRVLARQIPVDCDRIVVDIATLGAMTEAGVLGGRDVTVWVSRFPWRILQDLLDSAAQRHPDAPSLRDFRVPSTLADAEWSALLRADRLVTPHPWLADVLQRELGKTVERLPWQRPTEEPASAQDEYVYFPGPTIAREGALAVREAARRGGFPIVVGGKNLSDPGFWDGVQCLDPQKHPMERAAVVVAPAVAKFRPTALLRAVACGIPLIATAPCGVSEAVCVEFGDADALLTEIQRCRLRFTTYQAS